jgi:hypothetical protein
MTGRRRWWLLFRIISIGRAPEKPLDPARNLLQIDSPMFLPIPIITNP